MPESDPRDRGPRLLRGAAILVVVGTALGLAYNQSLLLANDDRALTWVAKQRTTGVLDLPATPATTPAIATPPTASPTSEPSPAGAAPATSSPAPTELATGAAHDTSKSTVHAARKKVAPAKTTAHSAAASVKRATTPPSVSPANPAPVTEEKPAISAPAIPDTREPLEARFAVVKALHDADGAVFVDARSAEDYAAGHIAGALSMPFDDVFKKPELARQLQDQGKPIVTYCDGGDCELSKDLAFSLIDAGHKKVVFFKDGLPGWKSGGGAVHTGPRP